MMFLSIILYWLSNKLVTNSNKPYLLSPFFILCEADNCLNLQKKDKMNNTKKNKRIIINLSKDNNKIFSFNSVYITFNLNLLFI